MKKKIIKYLAIIPCRKNSKRIKNKNLKKINDKSLVEITLNQAQKVKQIESIIISTDSTKILKIIKDHKKIIKFKRKKRLSKDNSTTESVILDVIQEYEKKKDREIKNIILLQATSPLRRYSDIRGAIKTYEEGNYDSLFSAHYEKLFLWKKKKKFLSITYNFRKRERTQKMEGIFVENGSLFIFNKKKFLKYKNRLFGKIGVSIMSKYRSFEVDTPQDFKFIKKIFV